ncbi:putative maf protein [Rhizopus microsporus ATCC 52813]|uniref:Putative maf protein n=1 Tax=Rhizopus microsporus ATCC 52813 TaxID=1340429 RepID=A0A2G4SWS2_RHIZD|nr:putative maf protein [Rhizopus microsporus ATCC 52813]PHZ13192.1 putative maf protein [Rhizopus microsporus ATCC 52813]
MPLDLPALKSLNAKSVVLASASPRRKEILSDMGIKFKVVTTLKPDENNPALYKTEADYVADTAYMKAKEVFDRCEANLPKADIVIGVDTVVVKNGKVFEKPPNADKAKEMLQEFSGSTHSVLSGVQIIYKLKDGKVEKLGFVEKTDVTFSSLNDETINIYVNSGEPFDKAGGYGIQGEASIFVKSIQGDYWNVVGLPKNHLFEELVKIADICV